MKSTNKQNLWTRPLPEEKPSGIFNLGEEIRKRKTNDSAKNKN